MLKDVPEDVAGAWFGNLNCVDGAHRQIELLVNLENVCWCVCTSHDKLIQDIHDLLVVVGLAHETVKKWPNIDLSWGKWLACVIICLLRDIIIILHKKSEGSHGFQLCHNVYSRVFGHYCSVDENITSIHAIRLLIFLHLLLFCKNDDGSCPVGHSFLKDGRVEGTTSYQVNVLESVDLRPYVGVATNGVVSQNYNWTLVSS